MKTIKVRMQNPDRRLWNPVEADYLTGTAIAKVPDVTYWRRFVKDGTLEIVEDAPAPDPSEPSDAPAPVDASASKTAKGGPKTRVSALGLLTDTTKPGSEV